MQWKKKSPVFVCSLMELAFGRPSVVSFYALHLTSSSCPHGLLLQHCQEPEIPTSRISNHRNRDSLGQVKFKSDGKTQATSHTKRNGIGIFYFSGFSSLLKLSVKLKPSYTSLGLASFPLSFTHIALFYKYLLHITM